MCSILTPMLPCMLYLVALKLVLYVQLYSAVLCGSLLFSYDVTFSYDCKS